MSSYIKLSTKEFPRHIGDIQIDGVWYWTWIVSDSTTEEIERVNKSFNPLNPFNLLKNV